MSALMSAHLELMFLALFGSSQCFLFDIVESKVFTVTFFTFCEASMDLDILIGKVEMRYSELSKSQARVSLGIQVIHLEMMLTLSPDVKRSFT